MVLLFFTYLAFAMFAHCVDVALARLRAANVGTIIMVGSFKLIMVASALDIFLPAEVILILSGIITLASTIIALREL